MLSVLVFGANSQPPLKKCTQFFGTITAHSTYFNVQPDQPDCLRRKWKKIQDGNHASIDSRLLLAGVQSVTQNQRPLLCPHHHRDLSPPQHLRSSCCTRWVGLCSELKECRTAAAWRQEDSVFTSLSLKKTTFTLTLPKAVLLIWWCRLYFHNHLWCFNSFTQIHTLTWFEFQTAAHAAAGRQRHVS